MLNWHLRVYDTPDVVGCSLTQGDAPLRFRDVIEGWRHQEAFRRRWAEALRDVPFAAYCWETPPLTTQMINRPFECVFVDSPALAGAHPGPEPFEEHFRAARRAQSSIAAFESLGRDAFLVAPCPEGEPRSHTHIAAFHREGPPAQVDQLWMVVAQSLESRIGQTPIWLSTAGLGVHWLHIRIDSRPKYYRHRPYASA